MRTKLDQIREAAAASDWRRAFSIAARFTQLGPIRAAVLDAHTAYTNPGFLRQIGRDPAACIAAGQDAMRAHYKLQA